MRRAILLFVVLVAVTLAVTLPGVAQEEEDPWAVPEEGPWAAEAGCDVQARRRVGILVLGSLMGMVVWRK